MPFNSIFTHQQIMDSESVRTKKEDQATKTKQLLAGTKTIDIDMVQK